MRVFDPIRTLLWVVVLAQLAACASAKFIATGPIAPAKSKDCQLEIFTTKSPDRDYVELGVLEGEGSFGADSLEDILPHMREKACLAGGDAIILTNTQKSVDVYEDSSDEQMNVWATVIRWKE